MDADTRSLVHEVLADAGHGDFVVEKVRAGIGADAKVAGRLALWGRRLVGEALSQAQRVAANRDALTSLLTGHSRPPGHGSGGDQPDVHPTRREPRPTHVHPRPAVLIWRLARRALRLPRSLARRKSRARLFVQTGPRDLATLANGPCSLARSRSEDPVFLTRSRDGKACRARLFVQTGPRDLWRRSRTVLITSLVRSRERTN